MAGCIARRHRTTLKDIAYKAGVSEATVSKVVNGKTDVSEQTRARVESIMAELSYFKYPATGPSPKLVEIAFNHLDSEWDMDILQGAIKAAQEEKVRLILSQFSTLEEFADEWMEEVAARRTLGAIAVFLKPSEDLAKRLTSRNVPCVFIDPWGDPASSIMSVQVDNWSGGLLATRHLLELGHRRIATITGPDSAICANARLGGYQTALMEAGVTPDPQLVRHGDFRKECGELYATELLQLPKRPTAIFAQSDSIATGVYTAAHNLGLEIPRDLSVVGFDDSRTAVFLYPELTTVRQPTKQMAETAIQMILDTRSGNPPKDRIVLSTSLIIRKSTAQPKQ